VHLNTKLNDQAFKSVQLNGLIEQKVERHTLAAISWAYQSLDRGRRVSAISALLGGGTAPSGAK
jgi:hypothetical protein